MGGELAITSPSGVTVGKARATVAYSAADGTGTVRLEVVADGRPLGTARARLTADRQEIAAGAVVALVLALTRDGPIPSGSSLVISDVEFDGDVAAMREHAVQLMDWWDGQGRLTYGHAYVGPIRTLSVSGRLQFNLWTSDGESSSANILLGREGNSVTGAGLITTAEGQKVPVQFVTVGVVSDYDNLGIYTFRMVNLEGFICDVTLHMLIRADGMVDVRGHSTGQCPLGDSALTLEGEGDPGIGQIIRPPF
jgi:hypothetical protein